ncbi:MAG: AMP-binding protein, partial [Pseudomonadota bacterium]
MTVDANLYTRLAARFPADRDKVFARLHDGRFYTYADVDRVSAKMAATLVALGVAPGDRVAAQVPKSIEAVMLYLGAVRAGAVFLPLNTGYTPAEIGFFVSDAEPRVFVCDPATEAALAPVAADAGAKLETLGVYAQAPGEEDRAAAARAGTLAAKAIDASETFETVPRAAEDLAAILYTSGTTGRSKGAMLSHLNLLSNAETLVDYWRFTADDVLIHALPIFHTHGLFVAVNTMLASGGSMIFLPKFDADGVLAAMPEATCMMGVPTFYTRLL